MAEHTIDTLVRVFMKIRDARSALKAQFDREYAKLGEQQERIEAELLRRFNDMGKVQNVKTQFGTAYREPEWFFSAEDYEQYWQWARDNDHQDAFEHRVGKRFIMEWMKENGGVLPPGLTSRTVDRIRIRAARS